MDYLPCCLAGEEHCVSIHRNLVPTTGNGLKGDLGMLHIHTSDTDCLLAQQRDLLWKLRLK